MRMVHYDHGSAVAVADVDGDGLYDIYFVNQVGGNELRKKAGRRRNLRTSLARRASACQTASALAPHVRGNRLAIVSKADG
jgi:hypothetical protein